MRWLTANLLRTRKGKGAAVKAWLYKNEYGTDIVLVPPTDENFYHYAGRNTKVNTPSAYVEMCLIKAEQYAAIQAALAGAETALYTLREWAPREGWEEAKGKETLARLRAVKDNGKPSGGQE